MSDEASPLSASVTTVGIVGVGYIAEAMVEAFLRDGRKDLRINLSPRGAKVASRLAERFPNEVTVAASNQQVLDDSQIIILAVRPSDADEVLRPLHYRPTQQVVSVVAGLSLEHVKRRVFPALDVALAIPLPAMRTGRSVTVLMPPNAGLRELFSRGGAVVETHDAKAYAALGTSTAIMSSTFALADTVATWLRGNAVSEVDARQYVLRLMVGLVDAMVADGEDDFERLAKDHATPGSFNDFLQGRLQQRGTFNEVALSLDALLPRMLGKQ